jgi:hypothetical protein
LVNYEGKGNSRTKEEATFSAASEDVNPPPKVGMSKTIGDEKRTIFFPIHRHGTTKELPESIVHILNANKLQGSVMLRDNGRALIPSQC